MDGGNPADDEEWVCVCLCVFGGGGVIRTETMHVGVCVLGGLCVFTYSMAIGDLFNFTFVSRTLGLFSLINIL